MRILIAVTHLLGAGHLTRAAALARACAAAGHETVLVSGGRPAPLVRLDGARLVALPPVHVAGAAFRPLLGPDGSEAGPDLLARRRAMLLDALAAARPDVVVTELFPFGRRALAEEFLSLVEAARARRPRPLVLASIRDILVAPGKPGRIAETRARLLHLYDAVLVHGDPGLVPLDASWPVDAELASRLRYTGYVDEGPPVPASNRRSGILVAAGSSAAGLGLFREAAEAARRSPELGWRILVGHGVPDAALSEFGRDLPDGVIGRARPDYRTMLAGAALSVSQCGYNTAVDILATRTPAVLVPFEAGRETEQRLRAERLAARGLARVLPEAELEAGNLLHCVREALSAPAPIAHGIDLGGGPRSVPIIAALHAARQADRPAAIVLGAARTDDPLSAALDRLRAGLDDAAERGSSARGPRAVWWRDDDAVAASPALDRLLGLSERFAVPVLIAAIPGLVEPSLARRIGLAEQASLAVHGLVHADHAPAGTRPAEFGPHRPLPVLIAAADDALGLARARLPGDRLLPVFVPPWNRLADDLAAALPDLGYDGLSAAPGATRDVPGLLRFDGQIDPVDWRGTRSLVNPDRLVDRVLHHLAETPDAPMGLLTHHLAHDAALWHFIERLLALLAGHPAVRFADPRRLFRPGSAAAATRAVAAPAACARLP
ncbi:glycosyltransferase [Methylobacterium durans]|uniref:glycosyltransferase n=1 Tax=Methylobacterium durans TaxID=2202825 RepID=UPI002AFFF65B|nr:glycosyltransferase [Methylobacterium durans]MEA1833664.1 glycosyltransferase [Methylobacterium durans]